MSVQILLQGKLLGVEEFLPSGQPGEAFLTGRLRWVNLLSEILPRALIAELGLSKMLLGSSGGDQFLVALPEEVRAQAGQFLVAARAGIRELSQDRLELFWAITENLGDWTVVRKRLNDEFQRKQGTPLAYTGFVQPNAGSVGSHGIAFADLLGGFVMIFARYAPILFALAVAGALAGKRVTPAGLGTMRTDNGTFVVLLIGVIILVGALTFFPALLLGPIVQGLTGHLY